MAVEGKTTNDNDDFIPIIDEMDFEVVFEPGNNPDGKEEPKKDLTPVRDTVDRNDDYDVIIDEEEEEEDQKKDQNAQAQESENKEENKQTETPDTDQMLASATNLFKSKGIFSGETEITSWEEFDEQLSELPKQIADSIVENAPELGQNIVDFVFSSGNRLTKESLKEYVDTYLGDIERVNLNPSISTTEDARSFLDGIYSERGHKKTVVTAMLDALEDEDDAGKAILKEAKAELEKLKAAQPKSDKLLNKEKQLTYEQRVNQRRFAKAIVDELQQTGWKPSLQQTIQSNLSDGTTNKLLSIAAKSPRALVQLANFARHFDEELGEFRFDDFVAQIASKNVQNIKKNISQDAFTSASSNTRAAAVKTQEKKKGSIFDHLKLAY